MSLVASQARAAKYGSSVSCTRAGRLAAAPCRSFCSLHVRITRAGSGCSRRMGGYWLRQRQHASRAGRWLATAVPQCALLRRETQVRSEPPPPHHVGLQRAASSAQLAAAGSLAAHAQHGRPSQWGCMASERSSTPAHMRLSDGRGAGGQAAGQRHSFKLASQQQQQRWQAVVHCVSGCRVLTPTSIQRAT